MQRFGTTDRRKKLLEGLKAALDQFRAVNCLTQKQLAARLGVSQQQVQKDEQTRYARAKFEHLLEIARVLGVHFAIQAVLPGAAIQSQQACEHHVQGAHVYAHENRHRLW